MRPFDLRELPRAALATTVVLPTLYLVAYAHQNSTYLGDDLEAFWQARTLPFLSFLVTPVDVHFVPLHRLVTWLVLAVAPMHFDFGLGLLAALHLTTALLLHLTLNRMGSRWATALTVAYSLNPCLGGLFLWWMSGLHRLGCVFGCAAALYGFVRYRDSGRSRWLLWTCASTGVALGFYSKGILVPAYVAALALALHRRGEPPATRATTLTLCATTAVVVLYLAVWHVATTPPNRAVNTDLAFHLGFARGGLATLAPTFLGFWLDPRPEVSWIAYGVIAALAALTCRRRPRSLLVWALLLLVLGANFSVLAAARAKSGLLGFALLLSDRYYFECALIAMLLLGTLGTRPAVGPNRSLPRRFALAAGLGAVAWQSALTVDRIAALAYPVHPRARAFIEALSDSVKALPAADRRALHLVDSPTPEALLLITPELRWSSALLTLMDQPVSVCAQGDYQVSPSGQLIRAASIVNRDRR